MPTLKALPKKISNRGFTLLELLVVMAVIGLGLMTIAPKLAVGTASSGGAEFYNGLITDHLALAKELNRQVVIKGTKGSDNIITQEGKTVSLPEGTVSRAYINGESTEKTGYEIYFYPDGVFDEFELTFKDGKKIAADPLRKTAEIK